MTDETKASIRWEVGESDKSVWRAEIDDYDYQPRGGCTTAQPIVHGDETICLVVSEGWDDTVLDERLSLIAAAPELLEALPDLLPVIAWLSNGCDPIKAADELKIYQARIDSAKAKAIGE